MNWEVLFGLSNALAFVAWTGLILAPRWPALLGAIRFGVIGLFCAAYAVLVAIYFFRVEGGGFSALHKVKTLFEDDPMLFAGWLHYLALDLFVGLWIAERGDARGLPRIIQAPILLTTFIFAPIGLLIEGGLSLAEASRRTKHA